MKYEIKKLYDEDEPLEETATLDGAREKAKLLSKAYAVWLVVFAFDSGKRTVRSFAKEGRLYWAHACKSCRGTGREDRYSKCGTCHGIGGTMDSSEEAA